MRCEFSDQRIMARMGPYPEPEQGIVDLYRKRAFSATEHH
jgi:hypothetical protein